jgi:hypothetical protein
MLLDFIGELVFEIIGEVVVGLLSPDSSDGDAPTMPKVRLKPDTTYLSHRPLLVAKCFDGIHS